LVSREVWGLLVRFFGYAAGRLSWKLGLLVSGLVLGMMLVFSFFDYQWHLSALWRDMEDHIAEEAWSVAAMLERGTDSDWHRYVMSMGTALDRGERRGRQHELVIIDELGVVRASTLPELDGTSMVSPEISMVLRGDKAFASGVMEHAGHLSFFGVVPFRPAGSNERWAIHVAEPLTPIQEALSQFLFQRLLFMAILTGTVIFVINLVVQQTVVKRLGLLARQVEAVKSGNLDARFPEQGTDEMANIGRAFNRMTSALRRSQDALEAERRRFALLYEVTRRLTGSREWSDLVDRILAVATDLSSARGCSLFLLDQMSNTLRLEGATGVAAELSRPLSHAMARSADAGRCLNCISYQAELDKSCPLIAQLPSDIGISSVACLRLTLGDRTIGFINLFLDEPAKAALRLDDLNLVAAEIAAVVAAVQSQLREMTTVEELQRALKSSLSLPEVLNVALRNISEAAGVHACAIFLLSENSAKLELASCHNVDPALASRWVSFAQTAVESGLFCTHRLKGKELAVFPILFDGYSVGALACLGPELDLQTQRILAAMATQIAVVVHAAQLASRMEAVAILRERNRLAREIHDGLIQHIGYLKLTVSRMANWSQQGNFDRIREEIASLRSSAEEAYAEARNAIAGLRVGLSPKDTLAAVLGNYVETFVARYQIPVRFVVQDEASKSPMKPDAILHILRIVQEALANVRKHSGASEATVEVWSDGNLLTVSVRDNGTGILSLEEASSQRGLRFMQERARELSGELQVSRLQPCGTEVTLKVPLRNALEMESRWPLSVRS
jgi:nitrate/nitrite-specific signal transduction histidine kinase